MYVCLCTHTVHHGMFMFIYMCMSLYIHVCNVLPSVKYFIQTHTYMYYLYIHTQYMYLDLHTYMNVDGKRALTNEHLYLFTLTTEMSVCTRMCTSTGRCTTPHDNVCMYHICASQTCTLGYMIQYVMCTHQQYHVSAHLLVISGKDATGHV